MDTSLVTALSRHIAAPSLVALSGGGGKTALMAALARRLAVSHTVISTTTTKIRLPAPGESADLVLSPGHGGPWEARLRTHGRVTLGSAVEKGKVLGLSPAFVDALHERQSADHLLVEADGARQQPFKAYEKHEPVLPARTTLQIVVVGAEIFLRPLSAAVAFRHSLLESRYGLAAGRVISLPDLAALLDHPEEYAQYALPGVPRLLLINKGDLARETTWTRTADVLGPLLRTYDALYCGSLRTGALYAATTLARRENL